MNHLDSLRHEELEFPILEEIVADVSYIAT